MQNETTEYHLDIDIVKGDYSSAFKEFYHNHFVQSLGLSRREIDLSFFDEMTVDEKELAKRLIRMNLKERRTHIIEAAGFLNDEEALPLLYDLYYTTEDLSWHLTIGRTIWKLKGEIHYAELLRKLKSHPGDDMRQAHFHQVTDLKNMESIEMLFGYLNDKDSFVRHLALSRLNQIETGKFSFDLQYESNHFLDKRTDDDFKHGLLRKLQNEP